MKLALFPPPGGGLKTLQQSGQLSRLTDYYLPVYARAFDEVFYFSYLNEAFSDYGVTAPGPQVHLVPNRSTQSHRIYAFTLARQQARWLAMCAVSRVFQATGILPAWRAKQRWGIPVVITYGYRYTEFARAEHRWMAWAYTTVLERLALRVADAIIVTIGELVDYVNRYVPHSRIYLIPNGVDIERFTPSSHAPRVQKPSILFVGRLAPQKNLLCLLRAIAEVQQTLSVRLDLVGNGPLREKLGQEAQTLGLDAHFHGTIPHEQLPGFYRGADVFVLPSHLEGHPKALLEAMACGLPVIVSDAPGNRAVVTNEVNGLTFPTDDAPSLAKRMRDVLLEPELARRLGAQARQTIARQFNLADLLQQEIAVLQQMASETTPNS